MDEAQQPDRKVRVAFLKVRPELSPEYPVGGKMAPRKWQEVEKPPGK